jgi:hypothetical protein
MMSALLKDIISTCICKYRYTLTQLHHCALQLQQLYAQVLNYHNSMSSAVVNGYMVKVNNGY